MQFSVFTCDVGWKIVFCCKIVSQDYSNTCKPGFCTETQLMSNVRIAVSTY